jgi:hypothetical protein
VHADAAIRAAAATAVESRLDNERIARILK